MHCSQQTPFSNNTKEDSTHGYHQMVNTEIRLITFFAAKDGGSLYNQKKKRPGADCGSDHELLIAKFRLKLKKIGKTTRPLRNNLNYISYDYTVKESEREVVQSCPTLCDCMNCSLPGSSLHGIFQARILEWGAIAFSKRSSQPRVWTPVSRTVGRRFTI